MTHRIVFLDRDTIAPHVNVKQPDFPHEWVVYDRTPPELVAERLNGASIAITNKAPIRADTLDGLDDLKMIAVAATGTDVLDVEACNARGIVISNIRGYAENTVPEHAFALILALRRSIVGYRRDVAAGKWLEADQFCFFDHPIEDLAGKQLGILGEGVLGSSVAAIAENGFRMKAAFLDHAYVTDEARKSKTFLALPDLLATSDVLTVHCPLTPDTHHLLDIDAFKQMKPNALVVNTARGAVIKEEDLAKAVEDGMIAGAGIDVLASEPPSNNHPYIKLLERPNFILTPHVAWASTEAMQTLSDQMIDNIENFVNSNPTNVVSK